MCPWKIETEVSAACQLCRLVTLLTPVNTKYSCLNSESSSTSPASHTTACSLNILKSVLPGPSSALHPQQLGGCSWSQTPEERESKRKTGHGRGQYRLRRSGLQRCVRHHAVPSNSAHSSFFHATVNRCSRSWRKRPTSAKQLSWRSSGRRARSKFYFLSMRRPFNDTLRRESAWSDLAVNEPRVQSLWSDSMHASIALLKWPFTFCLSATRVLLLFCREKKELQKILDRRRQNSISEAKSRDKDKAEV